MPDFDDLLAIARERSLYRPLNATRRDGTPTSYASTLFSLDWTWQHTVDAVAAVSSLVSGMTGPSLLPSVDTTVKSPSTYAPHAPTVRTMSGDDGSGATSPAAAGRGDGATGVGGGGGRPALASGTPIFIGLYRRSSGSLLPEYLRWSAMFPEVGCTLLIAAFADGLNPQ